MVDSFVSSPADPDHAIQLQIDEDLRRARQRLDEFERTLPVDPSSHVRVLVQRAIDRPPVPELYPWLTGAKEPGQWLMPLARRLTWNQARGEAAKPWADLVAEMLRHTMMEVRSVKETEFVALAEAVETLSGGGYLRLIARFVTELEKEGPLGAAAIDTLQRLLGVCQDRGVDPNTREHLLWTLFRAGPWGVGDSSWMARVRCDIEAMNPTLRANWLKAFHGESRTSKAGIQKLGSELEAGLRRWIGMLRERADPGLSCDDAVVFRRLINLCEQVSGPASDELLYEVARIPWTRQPEHRLLWEYLQVLRKRPQSRAFACLEALAMNRATATPDVLRQYEAQLAVFGTEATEESPIGVDGFPLDSDPALQAHHRRIDQLLRMAVEAASRGRYLDPGVSAHVGAIHEMKMDDLSPQQRTAVEMWMAQMSRPLPWFPVSPEVDAARKAMETAILQEFSADPPRLNRALTARAEWIREHRTEYSKDSLQLWNEWLHGLGCGGGLLGRSLERVDELELQSLIGAIRAGRNGSKVFELCQKYVAAHGWHIDLVEPFREFIPKLGVPCDHTENARAEWFLWFENAAPIDMDACWSYRVKRDLRAMPAEEAGAWRDLLDNTTFIITGTPPAKWKKAAEKRFPAVGVERFRRRFVEWFEPFAKGEPQRLTITGRNILRVLIWYVLIAQDEAVDHALLSFANARWKTKEFAKRVSQAEMAFAYVLGQRQPKGALKALEGFVAGGQAFEGSTTHRIYLDLCLRENRTPLKATPQKTKAGKEPAPNRIPAPSVRPVTF